MKHSVLVIAPYIPMPANFGGALRIYNLIKQLANEHDVALIAPGTQAEYLSAVELGMLCDVTLVPAASTARQPAGKRKRLTQLRSLTGGRSFLELSSYNPNMQAVINRLFMTREIDLVQQEFPESALYTFPRPVPLVFDAHNVEHNLLQRVAHSSRSTGKRMYNMQEARKLKRLEIAAWDRATICVATSDRDASLMRSLTSTPVDVVPNGVDLQHFSHIDSECSQPGQVVFTGAMRHQPNTDGALWYSRRVHPLVQQQLPGATFSIVGTDPPDVVLELQSPTIEVTGAVDDVRSYLAASQVAAVPLWSGGGTRLKVLEAMAIGRPVVSTTIGAEGLDVRHNEHLLIADSPDDFAHAVVSLCTDSMLSSRITSAARSLVEARYDWQSIAHKLVATHEQALDDRSV